MISNLSSRGIDLKGIKAFPTLKAQEERYLSNGWARIVCRDMNQVCEQMSTDEKERLDLVERLDEMEEWILIAQHYCIVAAYK